MADRTTRKRALLAETFGTFLLALIDAGVAIVDATTGKSIGVLGRSLATVGVITSMIFILGEVSGAHLNPAVSFAFALRGVFPWRRLAGYWSAQLVGAIAAGLVLRIFFGVELAKFGLTEPHLSIAQTFAVEVMLSWILFTSIMVTASAHSIKGWEAAFPVGATLLFCGLFGKEISGASMNPARSLGPALFTDLDNIWIYMTAPLLAAPLAVLTTFILWGRPSAEERRAAQGN